MANKHISEKMFEQIISLCEEIVKACNSTVQDNKSFEENVNKPHYTVKFPKSLPQKVLINGDLKDRANLSACQREAVRIQKEIDQAREKLKAIRQERINRGNIINPLP